MYVHIIYTYRYESGVAIFHMQIRNCFSGEICLCPDFDLTNDGAIRFKI